MVTTFSDSVKKTLGSFLGNTSRKTSKDTSVTYYIYEDIKLKTYYDIANTGNVVLIQKTGIVDLEGCAEAWETLVRRNCEVTMNRRYYSYKDTIKEQAELVFEYTAVKAMLTKLAVRVDMEYIKFLNIKGYRIYTGGEDISAERKWEKYAESLERASRRADNLVTKLKMSQNELKDLTDSNADGQSLGSALASLSVHLGFQLNDQITLAEYNEYTKIVKQKIRDAERQKAKLK